LFWRQIVSGGQERLPKKVDPLGMGAVYPKGGRFIEGEKLHLHLPSY
jgi:hypothetical protein